MSQETGMPKFIKTDRTVNTMHLIFVTTIVVGSDITISKDNSSWFIGQVHDEISLRIYRTPICVQD